MNFNRRGLFGLFAGAAITPSLPASPATHLEEAESFTGYSGFYTLRGNLSEIVTETLRYNSGVIANNIASNNFVLSRLRDRDASVSRETTVD